MLPFDPPRIEGLLLAPAAMLTGEVRLQEGAPESLTVLCWQDVGDVQQVSVKLPKEDEGRFSLDCVPTGVVQVVAISPSRGHSDVVAVTTRPGESTHVVLQIESGSSVVGTVLDQLTGKPLSDAKVCLMVGKKAPVAEVCSTFTDVDGRFVLRGAAAVGSFVVATAHGYSRQTRQVSGSGSEIDVGSIALPKTQSLTICLVDRDNSSSTGYTIHSEDGRIPLSRFDAEGCLTIEDVSAEQLECDITAPELTFFSFRAYLDPGEDWVFHVPVGGLASALVTFEGVQIEKEAELTLLYYPEPGTQILQTVFVERPEPIVLDGIPPGEVKAYLTEGSTELGSDIATVVGTQPVELTIQGESGVRIRVIDGSGAPVRAAEVLCAGNASAQSYAKRTDELGLCSFQLDPSGPLYAAVRHPEKGYRSATPVHPLPDQPFDIVLNPTSSLELAFHSTEGSVAGLSCMFSDPDIPFLFELSKNTDAAGVIRWDLLHDGRYFVSMFHHGFFPFEETLGVSGATRIDRTLRGRGALAFLVTDKDGLPLAEMPVALRSIVDDVSIDAWIEREWLLLPPQGLLTDGLGQLTIGELASGPYEWTVFGTSGSANVIANAVVQQHVALE